jgi:cytochrome c553
LNTRTRADPSGTRGAGQTEGCLVVQNLSPTDIEDLAAYYSAIEISVGKLPAQ